MARECVRGDFSAPGDLITPEWPAATQRNARPLCVLRCHRVRAGVVSQAVDGESCDPRKPISRYTGFFGHPISKRTIIPVA